MRWIGYFLVIFQCSVYGQSEILHFSTVNGLPHDLTYEVFQDIDGFIWIGTDNGVVKYDGQTFQIYNSREGLQSNFVIAIEQLSDSTIILGTWGGGLQFLKNDTIQTWTHERTFTSKINNLHAVSNTLYSSYGYRNLKIQLEKNLLQYQQQYIGFKNNNWIALEGNLEANEPLVGFSKVDSVIYGHQQPFLGPEKQRPKGVVLGVFQQYEDSIEWVFPFLKEKSITAVAGNHQKMVAATSDSLFLFNEEKLLQEIPLSLNGLIPIKLITDSKAGYFILAQDNIGYKYGFYYNPIENQFIDLRAEYGITSTLSDLLVDHESNLWITTYGEGVFVIPNKTVPFSKISLPQSRSSIVKGITQKKDSIYVLTNDQLIVFDPHKSTKNFALHGFGKSLNLLENDSLIVSSIKLERDEIVQSNYTEKSGFLYKKFKEVGIIHVNDSILINNLKIPTPESYTINDIIYFNDTLYLGTNMGLTYINDLLKNPKLKWVSSNLSDKTISSFQVKNDSTLWIGTHRGLYEKTATQLRKYTLVDGLASNQINTLFLDDYDRLWIGTQKGVSVFDENVFYNLSSTTGLATTYVSAIFEDQNKGIWLGGNNAITYINASENISLQTPPRINIENNDTQFKYAVITFNRPNALTTQYQINDRPWVTSSSQETLDFSDYKKGTYTFQLRSKKEDSDWGYSKRYDFKVDWVWYKNPLYLSLLFIGTLLIFAFVVQWRLKVMKMRNIKLTQTIEDKERLQLELTDVRNNIAKDFHDDMGNKLARISLLTRTLRSKPKRIEESEGMMDQIISDADELYKGTRDFIFSLRTESNQLDEFNTYLSDFGSELFEHTETSFETQIEVLEEVELPPYWTRQLLFIFKEALVNCYKHADAENVLLFVFLEDSNLKIQLMDDGVGMNLELLSRKSGLKNMQERAKRLSGELNITSTSNGGTKVEFQGIIHRNL